MNNKLILTISIIAVLILGAIALAIALPASGNDGFLNQKGIIKKGDMQSAEYSSAYLDSGACNSVDNYPCFKYPGMMQEKGEGHKEDIKQTRLEPCPKPKRICPLCLEEIKQVRGEGHMDNLVQTRVAC